jgi:hypothetical protein
MSNTKQQPLQGTTKLHGFVGCQFDSVGIDTVKGQIHNEAGAAAALGNTPQGGHTKAAKVSETWQTTELLNSLIWQHRPETFTGKISHFRPYKLHMIMRRGMGTTLEASGKVRIGPSSGARDDWHAVITEGDKKA